MCVLECVCEACGCDSVFIKCDCQNVLDRTCSSECDCEDICMLMSVCDIGFLCVC